jgi:hypothetical protein
MQTVTITSTSNISLDEVREKVKARFHLRESPEDMVAIEENGTRVFIGQSELDSGENWRNEILLDYHSEELVKKVIELLADDSTLIVENDYGTKLPGDEFVARIRANKGWNCRDEYQRERS